MNSTTSVKQYTDFFNCGTICGHTDLLIFITLNKQLMLCGYCTHSCGCGYMYRLACAAPPSNSKALPQSCSVYQIEAKVHSEFHTFLCPLQRKKAIRRGHGAGGSIRRVHTVALI